MNQTIHNLVALITILFILREVWFLVGSGNTTERLANALMGKNKNDNSHYWQGYYWLWMLVAILFLPRPASIIAFAYFGYSILAYVGLLFLTTGVILVCMKKKGLEGDERKNWKKNITYDDAVAIVQPMRVIKIADVIISLPFLVTILYYGLDFH